MVSYTCPACEFILIGEDELCEACPECGAPWRAARLENALLQADSAVPLPTASPPGRSSPRQRSAFWPGLLTGIALAIVTLAAGIQFGHWPMDVAARGSPPAAAPDPVPEPNEVQSVHETLRTTHAELRQARESLAAEQARARKSLSLLESRLASQEVLQSETLEILRATQAERDDLQRRLSQRDQELQQIRLSGGDSFVRAWQILGPLPLEKSASPLPEIVRDPFRVDLSLEGLQGKVRWQPAESDADRVALDQILNCRDRAMCYLCSWVYSKQAQRVRLSLGSDDGCCVWFNRKQVFEKRTSRSASAGQDHVDVDLQKGWNELLLNVDNTGGGEWAVYVEFRSVEGDSPLRVYSQSSPPPAVAN